MRSFVTLAIVVVVSLGSLALQPRSALAAGSVEHAAVETLRAGADMFLVCHNEEHVWSAYRAVVHEAERDRKFAEQVRLAVRRVLDFKKHERELRRFSSAPSDRKLRKLREAMSRFTEAVREATA